MSEWKMTPEEIMEAVDRLRRTDTVTSMEPRPVIVDYDAHMEHLKEENSRLRTDNANLRLQVDRLRSQLSQRVRQAADYVPYPDYEDR